DPHLDIGVELLALQLDGFRRQAFTDALLLDHVLAFALVIRDLLWILGVTQRTLGGCLYVSRVDVVVILIALGELVPVQLAVQLPALMVDDVAELFFLAWISQP